MTRSLRLLLVEDSEHDAFVLLRQLRRDGLDAVAERVETAPAFEAALSAAEWDVIVSDYVVPGFGGADALMTARRLCPDVPFIMVSGVFGEEIAVETMRAGATDYITKANPGRLGPAILRALDEAAERRRAAALEERLRRAEEQRERLHSIARLSGGLAHEINNLLQPILGAAEFLSEDLKPGSAEHADAVLILGSAREASAIVRNVLAFARGDCQPLTEIDPAAVLRANEALLGRFLEPEVRLTIRTGTGDLRLRGSEAELTQILINLVRNAGRAIDGAGGVDVAVRRVAAAEIDTAAWIDGSHWQADARPDFIEIAVQDSGCGIPAAEMERIFEPFFTSGVSREGVGLGLSVVYGIVKRWDGGIAVESRPGLGTRIAIQIPAAGPERQTASPRGRSGSESKTESESGLWRISC